MSGPLWSACMTSSALPKRSVSAFLIRPEKVCAAPLLWAVAATSSFVAGNSTPRRYCWRVPKSTPWFMASSSRGSGPTLSGLLSTRRVRTQTERLVGSFNLPYSPKCVEKLSKKSVWPPNEGVRSPRDEAKGPISSRYASEFHGRDTNERLFRQFQKVNSPKFASTLAPSICSSVFCSPVRGGLRLGRSRLRSSTLKRSGPGLQRPHLPAGLGHLFTEVTLLWSSGAATGDGVGHVFRSRR